MKDKQPPKWADRILEWYCDPMLIEDLQGDLHEMFHQYCHHGKNRKAQFLYIWLVFRSFRISAIGQNLKLKNPFLMMTKNNIKIALRVLWRDKLNSGINLLGLIMGITCFLLLGLYVKQELSYDQFHSKKDRIFRSWLKEDYGEGRIFFNSSTPLRFESLFEDNISQIERSVQYLENRFPVGRGEHRIDEKVSIISNDFFDVFDFDLIHGNVSKPLQDWNHIILSESYAIKYFGAEDPIGKTLPVQLDSVILDFIVTAIFEDMPYESSIQFDMAISNENNRRLFNKEALTAWFDVYAATYVLIRNGAAIESIENQIQDVVMSHLGEKALGDDALSEGQYNIGFQPLTDVHLNPNIPLGYAPVGNPQYVLILGIIATLVIIMACLNYTTLSIGQSLRRTREVGIRKVLGAAKHALTYQYLCESIVLTIIAMFIGVVLTIFLIPIFNTLTGTEIFYQFEWWHSLVFMSIGLIVGCCAGSYPALLLSGFKIGHIFNGIRLSIGKQYARLGLIVLQFCVSVFLVTTVLIMQDQIQYMLTKDLGYDYRTVVAAQLPIDPTGRGLSNAISSGMHNGELLKSKLSTHPEISNIAMGTHLFGSNGWANLAFTDLKGDFRRFRLLAVSAQYLSAFNIGLKEGRAFEPGNGLDQRQSVILNETAVRYFGIDEPIGKKLPGKHFGEHQIIGVVEDFNFSSLHETIEPLVIVQNVQPIFEGISDAESSDSPIPKIVFTYSGDHLHHAIDLLNDDWDELFPNEALNYQFLDERIRSQYEGEARLNTLVIVAAVLSICIAALGLFGLIMVVTNDKVKEIGIRKVMGATSLSLFKLIGKGFVIPIWFAFMLSVPISIYMMNKWLNNFAYRVNIDALPFLFAGLITLIIAGAVTLYHTVRASRVNPIESLRSE